MGGIIIDLQKDALASNGDVASLLRKAYLISKKLKLSEFENWTSSELNGYRGKSNIPKYREIGGELKAWNPYNGWIPFIITNNKLHDQLCRHKVLDSIPSLAAGLKTGQDLHIPFEGEMIEYLNRLSDLGLRTKYSLFLNLNEVGAIVQTVQNNILDWAILLEENGILGEGLMFSKEEKKQAENPQIINYINYFYGDTDNIQLQQGTSSSEQSK